LFRPFLAIAFAGSAAQAQSPPPAPPPAAQNPSPMAEETRAHERLAQRELGGMMRSFTGPAGRAVEMRIPGRVRETFDLVIHFHGASWLAHQAVVAADSRAVAAVLNLGAGSGAYARPFADAAAFDSLLAGMAREVTDVTGKPATIRRITLSGFSAGYGAIRAILREPRHFARVDAALLLDGMHVSYIPEGSPVANGGVLDTANMAAFAEFARAAVRGDKRFVVTHSEIFPGTFASTSETANWLLRAVGIRRERVMKWGPRGMQQLSKARSGKFELLGFAGNSAPDHIDHLHAMPELLKRLKD
jgi:hypothetical protein